MLTSRKNRAWAAAASTFVILALVGCGGEQPQPSSSVADADLLPPQEVETLSAPVPSQEETISAPPTPREPGTYANGDLSARIETAALSVAEQRSNRDGILRLGFAITFANSGSQPISLIMTSDGTPTFLLENGLTLSTRNTSPRWEMSGLDQCRYNSSSDCRLRSPDSYVEIEPGGTVTVNIALTGDYTAGQASGLNALSKGNLTMRLHMLQGDAVDKVLPLSMPNMTFNNAVSI